MRVDEDDEMYNAQPSMQKMNLVPSTSCDMMELSPGPTTMAREENVEEEVEISTLHMKCGTYGVTEEHASCDREPPQLPDAMIAREDNVEDEVDILMTARGESVEEEVELSTLDGIECSTQEVTTLKEEDSCEREPPQAVNTSMATKENVVDEACEVSTTSDSIHTLTQEAVTHEHDSCEREPPQSSPDTSIASEDNAEEELLKVIPTSSTKTKRPTHELTKEHESPSHLNLHTLSYEEYVSIIESCSKETNNQVVDYYEDILNVPYTSTFTHIESSFLSKWVEDLLEFSDTLMLKKMQDRKEKIMHGSRHLDCMVAAFRILSDPEKRSKYDAQRHAHTTEHCSSLLDADRPEDGGGCATNGDMQLFAIRKTRSCNDMDTSDISTIFATMYSSIVHKIRKHVGEKEALNDLLLMNPLGFYCEQIVEKDAYIATTAVEDYSRLEKKMKLIVEVIEGIVSNTKGNDTNPTNHEKSDAASTHSTVESSITMDDEEITPHSTLKETELEQLKDDEDDEFIREYYAVQLEKAKSFTAFENVRGGISRSLDVLEVDDTGFLKLYKGKNENSFILKKLKKKRKKQKMEELEIRRGAKFKELEMEDAERRKEETAGNYIPDRYKDKPYISDADGITDCVADIGESVVIFCTWFRDFLIRECPDLCCCEYNYTIHVNFDDPKLV